MYRLGLFVVCMLAVGCSKKNEGQTKGGANTVKIAALGIEVDTPSRAEAIDIGDGDWSLDKWNVTLRKKKAKDPSSPAKVKEQLIGKPKNFKSESINSGFLVSYLAQHDGAFVISVHKLPKVGDVVCRARNKNAELHKQAIKICRSLRASK